MKINHNGGSEVNHFTTSRNLVNMLKGSKSRIAGILWFQRYKEEGSLLSLLEFGEYLPKWFLPNVQFIQEVPEYREHSLLVLLENPRRTVYWQCSHELCTELFTLFREHIHQKSEGPLTTVR